MATDQRGVRAHPVPGQLTQPPRRHQRLGSELRQPQRHDLRDLVQRLDDHRAASARRRALAPPLQIGDPRPRRHLQQLIQHVPLTRREQPLQHAPQPASRIVADLRDQPRQRCHPWQQDLPLPQPRHPVEEDRFGAVPGRPRAGCHPIGELRLDVGELLQLAGPADLPLVIEPRLPPLGVPLNLRRVRHPQLPGHEVQHRTRHLQRVLQERAQPANGHQLQGEAEFHVLSATPVDQRPVPLEEEHPLQIRLRRRARVPAVGRRFIIRQELHRHRSQSRAIPPPARPQRSNRYKIPPPDADPHPNGQWR